MMDWCKCKVSSIFIYMVVFVLSLFCVSGFDVMFDSPTAAAIVDGDITVTTTFDVASSTVGNLVLSISNASFGEQLYTTATATYDTATSSYVNYLFDTSLYADGEYTLTANATSTSFQEATATVTFRIDNVPDVSDTIDCWDQTTRDDCEDYGHCRWDKWSGNCFQAGCWDFWTEDGCSEASLELGLPCNWNTGGSSGWCEDATQCWNMHDNDSCTSISGCNWDSSSYCQELNCWNYYDKDTCDSHADIGCEWDGWGCIETGGCWDYYEEDSCGVVDGCMWKSDAWCTEEGCWNYWDETSCDASVGCEWEEDPWMPGMGWCNEIGGCWNFDDQTSCEADGCYWMDMPEQPNSPATGGGDGGSQCMPLDCFAFSEGGESDCTTLSAANGLNCIWNSEWQSCEPVGCWDYSDESTCLANDCNWDNGWCNEGGCWDARSADECGAITDCTWQDGYGWCEQEACWNYNDEADCTGSSLNCGWGEDQWGGWCYEIGCWDYQNETACQTDSDCMWDGWNCYEPGCWDYGPGEENECNSDANCEWTDNGYCYEEGCWNKNDQSTCDAASAEGCVWEGSGWCTDEGCWNYNNQVDCDNNSGSGCVWDDQWNYCGEIDCYGLTTQNSCEKYNESLNCFWDGWSCAKKGCWNYWNTSLCSDADPGEGCSWESYESCQPRQCWNYKEEATCTGDEDCVWEGWCTGDYELSCWDNTDESSCSSAGCKWEGNCYEQGCWSYSGRTECCGSADCTESSTCGWETSGYCQQTGCWDYWEEGTCVNATGCVWDSTWDYCYEEGCWAYNDSQTCGQNAARNCVWDEQSDYCYKQDCWNYDTSQQCVADSNGIGGCAWDSQGEYCYNEGCWINNDQTTCDAQTNCEWADSGWCYDLGCWNYNTEGDCSAGANCQWDSTWEYCYEKGCWDYDNSEECSAVDKCTWDAGGSYCYEQGCWNYADGTTCELDSDCFWDNSSNSGWCKEDGCWDYTDSGTCEGNSCLWDYQWNYCYEAGCWENNNETGCGLAGCYWDTGSGGWCKEEGCWDHWDEEACTAGGCTWDSTYDYCYEEGCWGYQNDTSCDASGKCSWREDTWGWCEEYNCWSLWDQSSCESENDDLNCAWNSNWNYCEEVSCYIYDGQGEAACVNNSEGLSCQYSNGWCDPAGGFCSDFDGNMKGCMDTKYCFFDFNTDLCSSPEDAGEDSGFAEDMKEFNPSCWLFNSNQTTCDNINICSYNGGASTCDNTGPANEPVNCENITDAALCNVLPTLASCCKWRNGTCTTDFSNNDCRDNVEDPGEGSRFCEDENVFGSQTECNRIANHPWYMPCVWSGTECAFNFDAVVGSGGEFEDIKTEEMCEKAKGDWVCENYCDDNGTAAATDDKLKAECWCVPGSGIDEQICKKSCWACEYNSTEEWPTADAAQSACENSPANCEFESDVTADNGFGWCDFSTSIETTGGCDSSCAACNDVEDDAATAKPETKIACMESEVGCKWATNLANKSKGTCITESEKSCEESCFSCSEAECEAYGLNDAGACTWEATDEFCQPANLINDEICFNDKDDDNDDQVDCDDADCFFSPECGEGDQMHECFKYDQDDCDDSPVLAGAELNCSWITDPFGGQWCAHPSEVCWQYDYSETVCNSQGGACNYKSTGGRCDINKTSADACFGKPEAGCTGDCQWIADPDNMFGGGRCEFKMFSICHDSSITTQSGCTSGTNAQYCSWLNDPNSPNGGWCEPLCFNLNNVSCIANNKCDWAAGWCEPNVTTSEDCYQFDNTDASTCEASGACLWGEAMYGGECEPDFDFQSETDCWDTYFDAATCGADSDCIWMQDPYSGMGGFCENAIFACFEIGMKAEFEGGNASAACTAYAAAGCVWDAEDQECGNECDGLDTAACTASSNCKAFTGWCDPKGAGMMFEKMDAPPAMIAFDDCNEAGLSDLTDLCGIGVKDDFDVFGVSVGVRDMTDAATCNGEYIMDFTTFPPTQMEGTGDEAMTTIVYIGSDGDDSTGCNSSNNAKTGLDYKFVIESTSSDKESVSKYKCINSEWKSSTVQAFTMAKIMCGEANGPIVMLDKGSMFEAGSFDLGYDMVIYVLSKNVTSGVIVDAIEGIYTPGTVDFIPEDCNGFEDMDGDGLPPDKDPDCKFIKKYGGNVVENCHEPGDEDMDGLINCDDPYCKMMPVCGGDMFDLEADENDTTSASISQKEVETFPDSAFVKYDSNEPANGTLLFYGNDSTCLVIDATIYDIGVTDSSIPEYKIWHEGPIDEQTVGSALLNGTTYYYKLKVCDKAGNPCGLSACLNFTTEVDAASCGIKCEPVFDVKYTPPEDDSNLNGAGVQWDFGDGYEEESCGGLGGHKKSYNETEDIGVKIGNTDGSGTSGMRSASASSSALLWSIELKNMTIRGTVDTNKTSIDEDDLFAGTSDGINYVGMDHDKWLDLFGELNPKFIKICLPGEADTVWNCPNSSDISQDTCSDVTDLVIGDFEYNSALDCTEILLPADLGFSVNADLGTASTGGTTTTTGGGGGSSSCTSRWTCTDWGPCTNNRMTRTCTDSKACKEPTDMPYTAKQCKSSGSPITGEVVGGATGSNEGSNDIDSRAQDQMDQLADVSDKVEVVTSSWSGWLRTGAIFLVILFLGGMLLSSVVTIYKGKQ